MLKTLGFIFTALGAIGIFLPVLPTTPFLILAMFCFAKSSKKWHDWLVNNRVYGEYLKVYTKKEGLPLVAKIKAIVLMWLVMGTTIIFFAEPLWLKVLLIVIGVGVSIHLATLKTKK